MKNNTKRRSNHWLLLSPYLTLFTIFIVLPVIIAIFLSFTYFNAIEKPRWIGIQNYITLITRDDIFMQKVLPNTIKYALIVGVGGYILSFILAWLVAQLTKVPRTIFALILYSPSLTAGVTMAVVWRVLFNGDQQGYLNALLLNLGIIDKPIQWLQSPQHLMDIMILVSLWSSMGVGFLAMLAGILNIDEQLYEAAYIDGIKNRLQEIIYVTIPAMKPQMLFGAVMSIVNTFTSAGIGVALSGSNPTPQYAGQLIVNHIEDYGFLRYEMGYAAALSVVLLLIIWFFSRIAWRLFGER
ncbi:MULTISPECIES: carbohydrate ABC transporter permease [Fervidobacterium]|uniref:Binding-protein-dependent transport systems inner membrane component n=1 Tax=Fervidobacterium nodosum (strain ATCC 35602 / DSM 5306 / Rt17-B1) TaxID=381764 RepID=A7HJS6_FERNB|nr:MULTISPECIES: sugar ABC transporter permease [Fervidobacterium]ABS60159.1 binding-protein-dependent transport systems inner membrane component [Fervidobacterium nodosum Rt17-B1]KAF2961757.1 ABC transporter permease [Fervidobacterium sp. 2310opik-2]PHJ13864.1 ABC transporter permease [Fervidobacterium sp. SC_NGM5_G05]